MWLDHAKTNSLTKNKDTSFIEGTTAPACILKSQSHTKNISFVSLDVNNNNNNTEDL